MEYDNSFNTAHAFAIDISRWDKENRAFWSDHLGRRYLLTVVLTKARRGRILEIGAAWCNRYQKEIVGLGNELTIIDIKPSHSPDIVAIRGLDRYICFDMTQSAEAPEAPDSVKGGDCRGYFDEIRSWGVLSHFGFSSEQCERYLDNIDRFLVAGGQAIFKLDIDTYKVKKHAPGVGLGYLEDLIRARFTVVHTDVLSGNTPGHVLYVEKRS